MKKIIFRASLVCLVTILFVAFAVGQDLNPYFEGKVVAVIDGDTFTVLRDTGKEVRVRFQGVNAPEKGQPFAAESRQNLVKKLGGKQVSVVFSKTDNIGRILGKVVLDDEDVGLEQLNDGLGWYFTHYVNELSNDDRLLYDETQTAAKKAKRGLWRDASPQSPWAYRAANKIDEALEMQYYEAAGAAGAAGAIIANRQTKMYFRPDCPGYKTVAKRLRVLLASKEEAAKDGYRISKTCK